MPLWAWIIIGLIILFIVIGVLTRGAVFNIFAVIFEAIGEIIEAVVR